LVFALRAIWLRDRSGQGSGQVGGEPAPAKQHYTYAVLAQGRLSTPEEFGNVIVRETPNGRTVRVKDVARVELGTQDYSMICRLNRNLRPELPFISCLDPTNVRVVRSQNGRREVP
jgi:Cu/Ag efflux pump CusA